MLMTPDGAREVAEGVYVLGAQGNALAVRAGGQVVLMDTGPGGRKTDAMIASLRAVTDAPVGTIVYSHGHGGYNMGVHQWLRHAADRGEPVPRIIAHARVPHRFRRYQQTAGLQAWLNAHQFRVPFQSVLRTDSYRMPDCTYEGRMTLSFADREIVLVAAPSETDDVTALWIPDVRLLYGSAAVIMAMPNVGTPLRTLRDPLRWADSLDRLSALDPAIVVPEFGPPVTDPAGVADALVLPAQVLRWIHAEVVSRMNTGKDLVEILHEIELPTAWAAHRALKQTYGCLDYIVRDVWRSENGWWDRNPTSLHPATRAAAGAAVLSALGDPEAVLSRAEMLRTNGDPQLALHVLDLLVDGPVENPVIRRARRLKAEVCEDCAAQQGAYPSRQLYLSAADDLRASTPGDDETPA
jgi:alkyl sulfatase BDS1-like metallo-beta-lactamase superfamily hydrolase